MEPAGISGRQSISPLSRSGTTVLEGIPRDARAVGSTKAVEATPGRTFFMEKGTSHGFKNTRSSLAAVMKILVKESAAVAQEDAVADALRVALALARVLNLISWRRPRTPRGPTVSPD